MLCHKLTKRSCTFVSTNKNNNIMETTFMTALAYITLTALVFACGYTWGRIDKMLNETKSTNHAK